MQIRIDVDTRGATAALATDPARLRQVASAFLTRIAIRAKGEIEEALPRDIDRPTPFTQRSLRFKSSTKSTLTSSVYVLPIQAEYLYRLVVPGERIPLGRFVFVPALAQRTNRYGNMPKARRRRVLADEQLQVKRSGNRLLAFLKKGRRSEYVGVFVPRTRYPVKRWPFHRRAEEAFARHAERELRIAWDRFFREGRTSARG